MSQTPSFDIQSLIWGLPIAGIVRSAIELDVFDTLADSPGTSVEKLAGTIGADGRGTKILLDALTATGLVARSDEGYRLTQDSEQYLVSKSSKYIGSMVLLFSDEAVWQGYGRLSEAVVRGGSVLSSHAEREEYELWDSFPEHTVGIARRGGKVLANLLHERLSPQAPLRVLDLACGTGLYGYSVAANFPNAVITSLDWERVLMHSRPHATQLGVQDRVNYIAGDMFSVDLGGTYDVIIASHVFHHFDDARSGALMQRLAQATKAGGTLAIHDFIITEAAPALDPEPYWFAATMLVSSQHGDTYTKQRFDRLLQAAGYGISQERQLPRMPTRFLFAERIAD